MIYLLLVLMVIGIVIAAAGLYGETHEMKNYQKVFFTGFSIVILCALSIITLPTSILTIFM